jgi:hypothetical protein
MLDAEAIPKITFEAERITPTGSNPDLRFTA